MQPFQGKKLKKPPHRASSQQTDAALSRLQVLGCRMNQICHVQRQDRVSIVRGKRISDKTVGSTSEHLKRNIRIMQDCCAELFQHFS